MSDSTSGPHTKAQEWKQIGNDIATHSPKELAVEIGQNLWSKQIGVAKDEDRYKDYQHAVNLMAHPNMTHALADKVNEEYKKLNGASLYLEFEAIPWLTDGQRRVAANKITPEKL
jgi:hypothetical protein